MKNNIKIVVILSIILLLFNKTEAQFFHATIGQGADTTRINIYFKPSFNSTAGEYAVGTDFAIAVPTTTGLTASFLPNATGLYRGLTFTNSSEVQQTETVFGYHFVTASTITMDAWASGTEYLIGTITFGGNTGYPSPSGIVKLVDRTNNPSNVNGYFDVTTNVSPNDRTDYGNFFYQGTGSSAQLTDANTDKYLNTSTARLLPITLVSFTAVKSGTANNLNWIVSSEINAKSYDVERSSANGANFTAIGHVTANNNGKYSFTDASPLGGVNYYRLKMVDMDGQFKYSEVRSVLFDGTAVLFDIYPNPVVTNTLYLHLQQYTYEGNAQAIITDIAGRSIQSTNIVVVKGNNQLPLTVKKLTKGTYFVTVYDANGAVITETKKLVK